MTTSIRLNDLIWIASGKPRDYIDLIIGFSSWTPDDWFGSFHGNIDTSFRDGKLTLDIAVKHVLDFQDFGLVSALSSLYGSVQLTQKSTSQINEFSDFNISLWKPNHFISSTKASTA